MRVSWRTVAAVGVALFGIGPAMAYSHGKSLIGKDLTGWKARGLQNGWKVERGMLVNTMPSSDLYTEERFRDFELHYEYNVPKDSNSGMYLRGRYEVQIVDDYGSPPSVHGTGAIYGRIAPKVNAARPAGEWQRADVRLVGTRVTVTLNGKRVIENQEIPGPTGAALDDKVDEPGPILLQGDHGPVMFRNIRIRVLAPPHERDHAGSLR